MFYSITSNNIDIVVELPTELTIVEFGKLESMFLGIADYMIEEDLKNEDIEGYIDAAVGYWFFSGTLRRREPTYNKSYFYFEPFEMKRGGKGRLLKHKKKMK